MVRRTDHMEIIAGLTILSTYDDSRGDVSMSNDRVLYAGPQEEENLAAIVKQDRTLLQAVGWHFDDEIGRWGWH